MVVNEGSKTTNEQMLSSDNGCAGVSIPTLNPVRTQRDAAGEEVERVVLSHNIKSRDIQIKSLVDTWLREYHTNQVGAKRRILELIFHCINKDKQPLTDDDFVRLSSLTVDSLNDWLMELRVGSITPDHKFYLKVLKFMKRAFNEAVLLNEEFFEEVYALLSIMMQSHKETARYTASLFVTIMIRTNMNHYLKLAEDSDETTLIRARLVQSAEHFLKLLTLLLRDVSLLIRANSLEFFWSLCFNYPAIFLNSSALHHIYLSLFDRNFKIRLYALKACQFIIVNSHLIEDLEMFRHHLYRALVAKCMDPKKEVAIEGIKMLTDFYRKYPDQYSVRDLRIIVPLLFSKEQKLATKVAGLLYSSLQRFHDDTIKFNKHILSLVYSLEDNVNTNCEVILMHYLLPLAGHQLTDWNAWLQLFLGDYLSKQLINVGFRVFLRIIKYYTTFQLEGDIELKSVAPLKTMLEQKEKRHKLTEEHKYEMELHQEDLTNIFGSHMIQLWDKYKFQPRCLKYLLKIPQVFVNSDTLELKSIFDYLIHLKLESSVCLSEAYRTLASILHLMRSCKWTTDIQVVEEQIYSFCGINFLHVCKRLATFEYCDSHVVMSDVAILKTAYYVTKYFDLTKTALMQNAIIALKYGLENKNILITRTAAYMCLYNVHWQLKNIVDDDHSGEELQIKGEILKSYISKIIYLIEPKICFTDSEVLARDFCNIFSQLCILFSSRSEFVRKIPGFKMSPIPLLTSEWLHFYLVTHAPVNEVPKDPIEYVMAKYAIEQFCLLLSSGAMDISYFSSIMPYFSFYEKPKNYNDILQQAIKELIVYKCFPTVFIESLVDYDGSHTFDEVQVVVNGICSAGVQKLKVGKTQKFAMSVLIQGIYFACSNNDLMLFPLFLPFVKLLSQKHAEYLLSAVLDSDPCLTDDIYVEEFISGLQNRICTT